MPSFKSIERARRKIQNEQNQYKASEQIEKREKKRKNHILNYIIKKGEEMRKVIIIDNNRIGLFNLCQMSIDESSEAESKLRYNLNIKSDSVLISKTLVRKIEKAVRLRRKYEGGKKNES